MFAWPPNFSLMGRQVVHAAGQQRPAGTCRELLARAQAGSEEAFGDLLELYRSYLLWAADKEMDRALQAKVGPSDVVQDAFMEAQRLFARFQGDSGDQFRAWLRTLLDHKVLEQRQRYQTTQKRQLQREQSLETSGPAGSLAECLPGEASTPSAGVMREEEASRLRQFVERLPEVQRQVVVWHHWEEVTFAEIGRRLQRSEDAVRMIFGRAMDRLAEEVEGESDQRSGPPG